MLEIVRRVYPPTSIGLVIKKLPTEEAQAFILRTIKIDAGHLRGIFGATALTLEKMPLPCLGTSIYGYSATARVKGEPVASIEIWANLRPEPAK